MFDDLTTVLVQYQYPIATGLSAVILYFAQKIPGFKALGDWTKRAALGLSAVLVVAGIRALGGEVSPDVGGLLGVVVGGGASAVPGAMAFRMGRIRMKALLVGLLLVGGVACASASPPRGFPLAVVDTGTVTVTCPPAGPNVGCVVSVADSISGQVVWANQSMTVGQTLTAVVNGVPGQRMVLKGTMVGVAPNVPNSSPVFARAEGTFPFPGAQPPVWVIQFTFPARP